MLLEPTVAYSLVTSTSHSLDFPQICTRTGSFILCLLRLQQQLSAVLWQREPNLAHTLCTPCLLLVGSLCLSVFLSVCLFVFLFVCHFACFLDTMIVPHSDTTTFSPLQEGCMFFYGSLYLHCLYLSLFLWGLFVHL